MSRSNPWMKFYPTDWQSDEGLQACSLAARGLWFEMLLMMHKAEPMGHLLVGGSMPSVERLARLVRATVQEVESLLSELREARVFSVTKGAVIYCRRMVMAENRARISRENGKLGGNPSLRKRKGNPGRVNPEDIGWLKTQSPESRVQKEEESSTPLSKPVRLRPGFVVPGHLPDGLPETSDGATGGAPDEIAPPPPSAPEPEAPALDLEAPNVERIDEIGAAFAVFQSSADQIPTWSKPAKLTAARKAKLRARLKDCGGLEGWKKAVSDAMASPFLCGETREGFRMGLDFMLQESSFNKLREGFYAKRPGKTNGSGSYGHGGRSWLLACDGTRIYDDA